jgi:AcrR family transcriptional regulator
MTDDLRADARQNIRSILEAAARVLADDPAAGMQAIADAAAVSRPTVYRHFPRREELIDAIRLEAMTEALEALDAAAASEEPAAAALERLILDLADIAVRYPLLGLLIGTRGLQHKAARRSKNTPLDRLVATFDTLIERGRRDGTLAPDLRPEILGPATMGALLLALKTNANRGRDTGSVGAEVAAIVLGGARSAG